jgi:hypothetical protein
MAQEQTSAVHNPQSQVNDFAEQIERLTKQVTIAETIAREALAAAKAAGSSARTSMENHVRSLH